MTKEKLAARNMSLVITFVCCFLFVNGNNEYGELDENAGKAYLNKINAEIQVKTTESVVASWDYESNITDENLAHQLNVSAQLANYTKEIWKETVKYPWMTYKDPNVRRQFQKFSVLGTAILSPEKYDRFNKIVSDMQSVYGKAKICNYHNRSDCSLQLEPELTEIFAKSKDPLELRYYWEQWRNAAGKPVRNLYKEYVDLSNEVAVLNNFSDCSEFWLKDYEAEDFKEQVKGLWDELRSLYLQLHAYVRRRLRDQYGEQHITKRGPIPAHLLGNMWGQSWGNIFNATAPYPNKPSLDVTPNMVKQGYTPLRMFKLAEEFFISLGLSPMPESFWKNSILEKPQDGRDLICHASAWDFYDGKDFRIKQCTRVTFRQLVTVHHEMGHIQYYIQYKHQPKIYRRGANPGFHEAVGDVMALSVSTPKHLRKIGLLSGSIDDAESEINQLYSMALDKIAFLPFGYLMDQWRWSVFQEQTTEKDYNCKWWKLREQYQGLSPSVIRTEADFDPGAKYHTVGNVPYIRYFVSFVIQFQFHRSLCIAAKEYDPSDPFTKPLHKCDIYQSKEAGELLKKMLEMGSSKPWPEAMEILTGQRKMDARPLLEYFSTLQAWLEKENKKTNEYIGWETSAEECKWQKRNGNGGTSSDTTGNFMGENIPYSYAEFVRQDDNYFVPLEYGEEVQPSYHEILHRIKKNDFQGDGYAQLKNKFSGNNQASKNKAEESNRNLMDRSGSEYSENTMENMSDKSKESKLKEAFMVRSKDQTMEKTKIMNAIMNDINKRMGGTNSHDNELYKWVTTRDTSKIREEPKTGFYGKDKQRKRSLEFNLRNTRKRKSNLDDQQSDKDNKKFEMPEATQSVEQNSQSNEGRDNYYLFKHDGLGNTFDSGGKFDEGGRAANNKNPQSELMYKSEQVKNEAKELLKNFNLSYLPDDKNISDVFQYVGSQASGKSYNNGYSKETNSGRSQDKRYENILSLINVDGKSFYVPLNSFERFLKREGVGNLEKGVNTYPEFTAYNLIDVVPINRVAPDSDTLLSSERRLAARKRSSKRSSDITENNKYSYLMLVGKLADGNIGNLNDNKKDFKKSYKEFYYNVKTPVVYNSVVITPGTKNSLPEEIKDHWLKTGDSTISSTSKCRNSDEMTEIFKRKRRDAGTSDVKQGSLGSILSKTVTSKQININNVLQYFGLIISYIMGAFAYSTYTAYKIRQHSLQHITCSRV